MKEHFVLMARYNGWANTRLYRMARALSDEQYRRDVGAYFESLHGTLNHLLVADRIWMSRFTGTSAAPARLDGILFEDLAALTDARRAEDERIVRFAQELTDAQLDAPVQGWKLKGPTQPTLGEMLAHFFNHQTHHRGQAHAILTSLGVEEPDSLDLLAMLREHAAATAPTSTRP